MTRCRLDASRVLKRISKVRELRAAVALGSATREERACRHALDGVEAACDAVAQAIDECLEAGRRVDTARYDMLAQMGAAFAQQHERTACEFDKAAAQRRACAADNVQAKRRHEQVGERVAALEQARRRAQTTRMDDDVMDLWLKHQEAP